MTDQSDTLLGWHFARSDGCLGYDDGRKIIVGETLTVDCDPVLCESGLHAAERVIDALTYAAGPIICRVRLGGRIVRGVDKAAGTSRTCLAMADATSVLHEFVCLCAEQALARVANPHPRSVEAIACKRRWLAGAATDAELATAYAATSDTAFYAARAAVSDAAYYAAYAAASDAAFYAARAARDVARDVACDAAYAAQNTELESRLASLLKLKLEDES